MKISSPSFLNNEPIPDAYTCKGANISPRIEFHEVPRDTKSLAFVVDDPDAPDGTFLHWMIWNIDPLSSSIPEGGIPYGAIEGENDFGFNKYQGPCPPPGTVHHYRFRLFALDAMLELSSEASEHDLGREIEKHLIEKAEYVGTYKR
jgi:Raf kinase inhibitor-like YbhB/YbcL family protein